jgi:SGNH domain (fused to AT3 domains)
MFDASGQKIEGSMAISRGLRSTLDLLESIGVRVLIVGVPPDFPFDVPKCLWRLPSLCSVDRSWNEAVRNSSRNSIEAAIHDRPGTRFVELFDPLCPAKRCSAGTLDEPLLADRTHLSVFAAHKLVLPILTPHLDWLRGAAGRDSWPNPPK